MKKILILGAFLLLAGGGGAAALYFLEIGPFAPPEGAVAGDEQPAADAPVPNYVDMQPLSVPIFEGDRVATTIQIQISLQVSEENQEIVTHRLPKLRDALLRDLYSYLPRLLRRSERLDIVGLKRHLHRVAERALGEGLIDDILVQSVLDTQAR